MPLPGQGRNLLIGAAAGYVATKVTDRAQAALWRATPAPLRAREPRGEPAATAAARMVCDRLPVTPDERRIRRTRAVLHYGLGAIWGLSYALLRRYARLSPLTAGAASGTSLSLLIDEGLCPTLGISKPPRTYPASSHVRGLLTHLVYGLSLACTAEALQRVAPAPSGPARHGVRLRPPRLRANTPLWLRLIMELVSLVR